jgi:vesicle coat complex subunit
MDYIMPAQCSETQFRAMWTEFEWENKVNVNTNITDLMGWVSIRIVAKESPSSTKLPFILTDTCNI